MKKICIVAFTGLMFLTACQNSGSSTIGTYEKEETSQSSEKTEGESNGAAAKGNTENAADGTQTTTTTDTTLNSSGAAREGASAPEIKTGSSVNADTTNIRGTRP